MNSFYTAADLERYTGQKRLILQALGLTVEPSGHYSWWRVEELEAFSGAKRVASRIDELRNDWRIQTRKNPVTKRAMYKLIRKLTEPREKKPHCHTCCCYGAPETAEVREDLKSLPHPLGLVVSETMCECCSGFAPNKASDGAPVCDRCSKAGCNFAEVCCELADIEGAIASGAEYKYVPPPEQQRLL